MILIAAGSSRAYIPAPNSRLSRQNATVARRNAYTLSHRTGLVLRMRIVSTGVLKLEGVLGAGIAPMRAGACAICGLHAQRSLRDRADCCQGKSDFCAGLRA